MRALKTIFEVWPVLRIRSSLLISCCMLLVVSCATVPHTGRKQLNFVSDRQLNALGAKAFGEILAREPVSGNDAANQLVKRVAERIGKAADDTDKPGFEWDIKLIDKDVPNAFCLPGGKIVIYKGILPYAKTEAGLAAIIGHEVAHAVARHGGERLSQQLTLEGASAIGSEIFRSTDGKLDARSRAIIGALGFGATVGVILPFSRTHEFEADRIGQTYMAKAGYDPEEAVRLWERMATIKKPPIPPWLSTHPADEERVKKLVELTPEAKRLFLESKDKVGIGSTLDGLGL